MKISLIAGRLTVNAHANQQPSPQGKVQRPIRTLKRVETGDTLTGDDMVYSYRKL